MKSIRTCVLLSGVAVCALVSGCQGRGGGITGQNAAPGIVPGASPDGRQQMIQWHQEHDRKPAAPAASQ